MVVSFALELLMNFSVAVRRRSVRTCIAFISVLFYLLAWLFIARSFARSHASNERTNGRRQTNDEQFCYRTKPNIQCARARFFSFLYLSSSFAHTQYTYTHHRSPLTAQHITFSLRIVSSVFWQLTATTNDMYGAAHSLPSFFAVVVAAVNFDERNYAYYTQKQVKNVKRNWVAHWVNIVEIQWKEKLSFEKFYFFAAAVLWSILSLSNSFELEWVVDVDPYLIQFCCLSGFDELVLMF